MASHGFFMQPQQISDQLFGGQEAINSLAGPFQGMGAPGAGGGGMGGILKSIGPGIAQHFMQQQEGRRKRLRQLFANAPGVRSMEPTIPPLRIPQVQFRGLLGGRE